MKPLAIDLFCGAGGMSEGIIQAGFHVVYSSDINDSVMETYTNRHRQLGLVEGLNTQFERADIRDLSAVNIVESIRNLEMFSNRSVPPIDVIFGGPPCQGFSRAGLRRQDDPRNMLFKEYLRIVSELQPKYVVMENVEGFLDTRLPHYIGLHGAQYDPDLPLPEILLNEFTAIGYRTLVPRVLDASDFGVPQRRKRAIFIAYRDGQAMPQYPQPTILDDKHKVTVLEAIGDLIVDEHIRKQVNPRDSRFQRESKKGRTLSFHGKRLIYDGGIRNHQVSRHHKAITERFALYKQGESATMVRKRILEHGVDLSESPALLHVCARAIETLQPNEIIQRFVNKQISDEMVTVLLTRKNSRMRLHCDRVAPTMVTLPDDFISPFEDRILTVREMARLQSFDDSFEFLGTRTTGGHRRRVEVPQYTQVGNAVPPLLARAVAMQIKSALQLNAQVDFDDVAVARA